MTLTDILTVTSIYVEEGHIVRNVGKFDGVEKGIILVMPWGSVRGVFIPWEDVLDAVKVGALKGSRMSNRAGGGINLRPLKKVWYQWYQVHQDEFRFISWGLGTDLKKWTSEKEAWTCEHGGDTAVWNFGWYAEFRVYEYYNLDWAMVRNNRRKGQSDIVITTLNGTREHWEIKDLTGSGFQIRPQRAKEIGLDDLIP